jgi:hypothetical protein
MHRDERRGTSGIYCDAGPVKVQTVRNSIGGDAERRTGGGISIDRTLNVKAGLNVSVVGCRDPDKNACSRPGQPIEGLPGILQRLPGNLQKETLLRIDVVSFPRRDAKEFGFEPIDALNEPAPA